LLQTLSNALASVDKLAGVADPIWWIV